MAAAEAKDPRERLGAPFWWLLAAGFVVLLMAYAALIWWNFQQEHWSSLAHVTGTIVFTVSVWSLAMVPYFRLRRRGVGHKMRPPIKRYMMRFMPAMLLYVVILTLTMEIYKAEKPAGALAWAVALLPTIPLLFAIRAIMLLMKEEDDEFQRMLHLKAFVLTTGLMLGVCTLWGFLEMFSLVPHVPMWAAFPLWAVCLVPGQLVTRWKWR
jgi:hypothetical protein